MQKKGNGSVKRWIALLLAILLFLPSAGISVANAAETRASFYLDDYSAYVHFTEDGVIQVWFDVMGTHYLDDIGALKIELYESTDNENWTWVKTYTNRDHPNILGHNAIIYCSHVDYTQGISGRYYRGYITVWGGRNGGGDTRYFYTSSKLAP